MNNDTPELTAIRKRADEYREHSVANSAVDAADRAHLLDLLDAARTELKEHDHSFELRRSADMRAIKRWQAARRGDKQLVWPDHADLVVWLLEQVEKLEMQNEKRQA